LKGVDLTEAQEKQVRDIMSAHRGRFRTLFDELRAAQKSMADALLAPGEVRGETLTAQAQRLTQLREQLMQEGLQVALEVRAILTPEQLATAAQLHDRMRALHTEMRGLFKGHR
jgi:Spy/CpxP family protein refolding chaperone